MDTTELTLSTGILTSNNGRSDETEQNGNNMAPPGSITDSHVFGEPPAQSTNGRPRRKVKRTKEPVKMETDGKAVSTPALQGTKRKDRPVEQIDPRLVGPGTSEEPPPKRRGSTIDTQKIDKLDMKSMDVVGPSVSTTGNSTATIAWQRRGQDKWGTQLEVAKAHMDPNAHGFNAAQHMQMMPGVEYHGGRAMSGPESPGIQSSAGPVRTRSSRSRPPSRGSRGDQAITDQTSAMSQDDASSSGTKDGAPGTPYSRSPELRVSHKLAERKRRKEMKDLFDELRDQLPQDRGMKASKWEILSKAIDFIVTMKQTHGDMSREIDMLRHEVDGFRQGMPPFHPNGPPPPVMFGQHIVPGPYPPGGPVPHGAPPHPGGPPPPNQQPIPPPARPGSSQNSFPPGDGPNANSESGTDSP